jgi:hypothetical protein
MDFVSQIPWANASKLHKGVLRMAAHEEIYVPPAVEDVLPEEVVRRLDGSDLETKAKEAIRSQPSIRTGGRMQLR